MPRARPCAATLGDDAVRELALARARLHALETTRSTYSLAPPIAVTVAGFASAVVALSAAADAGNSDRAVGISIGAAGLGAAAGVAGLYWTTQRNKERRRHDPDIYALRARIAELEEEGMNPACAEAPSDATFAQGGMSSSGAPWGDTQLPHEERVESSLSRSVHAHRRAAVLRREREQAELEKVPFVGPLILTVSASAVGAGLLGYGAALNMLLDYPEDDPDQLRASRILLGTGAVFALAGVGGAVVLAGRNAQRRDIRRRFRSEGGHAFDLRALPALSVDTLGVSLAGRF